MPPVRQDVRLVAADLALITADAQSASTLAARLGLRVPDDWPPEHHDEGVLRFTAERLASSQLEQPWWLHYVVVDAVAGSVLVGTCGYKGPPREGKVDIGYSVVPSWQRQGIATAAIQLLMAQARDRGVRTVVADTLPTLTPSIGVLRNLGFVAQDPPEPGVLRFARRL